MVDHTTNCGNDDAPAGPIDAADTNPLPTPLSGGQQGTSSTVQQSHDVL